LNHLKKINTWDYQWQLAIWRENGHCISPNFWLTRNNGFGELGGGVHTTHGKYKQLIWLESVNERGRLTVDVAPLQDLFLALLGSNLYRYVKEKIIKYFS
jgi:hypothetical protein